MGDAGEGARDGRHCSGCGQEKPLTDFYEKGPGGPPTARCRACVSEVGRLRRGRSRLDPQARLSARASASAAVKAEKFAAYGGRCACCGEAHPLFLRVERVRREDRPKNEVNDFPLWRKLRAAGWPGDFELLCANCSLGKSALGVCPHRAPGGGRCGLEPGGGSPQ